MEQTHPVLRPAVEADLARITEIYNQAIRTRRATGHMVPFTMEQRRAWFRSFEKNDRCLEVVILKGRVAGYAHCTPWREGRQAMLKTAEVSFFIDEQYRRMGLGSRLLERMILRAQDMGKDHLLAILLDINVASVALLEKFGFERWGHFPGIIDFDEKRCGQYVYGRKI